MAKEITLDPKLKDIYVYKGVEIVPIWKQCGEPGWDNIKNNKEKLFKDDEGNFVTCSEWLWKSGDFSKHMESLNRDRFEDGWYVWKKYLRGWISLEKDDKFRSIGRADMCEWDSPKNYTTVEEAIDYFFTCFKDM